MRIDLLLFVTGAWFLQHQAVLPSPAWIVLSPSFFFLAMLVRNRLSRETMLKGFFLVSGFLYAAAIAHSRIDDRLASAWEGRDIDVVGIVASLPQRSGRGQSFLFDVENRESFLPRRIMLNRYSAEFLHPGERWRFTVRLKRPHGNANPYGFDYEAWLIERDIGATGYVRQEKRLAKFVARPAYLVEALREKLAERVQGALRGFPYSGVIAALLMGEQNAISEKDWRIFRRTGVIHLMSISGLHVTMIAGFFAFLAHRIWRVHPFQNFPARKASALAGFIVAFCYALLAGFAIPTQRTVYMLATVAAAVWLRKTASPSTILCWALFVVTLFDPWCALSPGFWLSFFAVALILYVETGRIGKRSRMRSWISVQWAMTIGLVPLLLVFFGQISLVAPLANAVAIPLVSLAVVPLTLLGAVLPFDFPFVLAHAVFSMVMELLVRLSDLPSAAWVLHVPPNWAILTAFVGIFWILLPEGFPARWLGISGIAPLFLFLPPHPERLRLTVLDVGQGLSCVIETRHHALLYDAGPAFSSRSDSGSRIVLPYLAGSGITRLDGAILSHEDMDHIGGAISVLDAVPTGWLLSSLPDRHPVLNHVERSMRCRRGQSWTWDEARFEILSPDSYSSRSTNERSCVLKVTSREGSILMAGDIDSRIGDRLALGDHLKTDVLVAPHHGGKSSERFALSSSPRYVVFSSGYRNRFGHPRPEVATLYARMGSRIVRTDEEGAAVFDFSSRGLSEASWRKVHRRYWYHEK